MFEVVVLRCEVFNLFDFCFALNLILIKLFDVEYFNRYVNQSHKLIR